MANRIVAATVSGENIKLSNKIAGAAGSHNAVSLSLTFDSAWDGTTKKIYFFDRDGNNAVFKLLTTDLLIDGAYIVPIPSEPLAKSGMMTITIRGVEMVEEKAERIIMSASTTMKVLDAETPASDVAPVEPTPTQAEQLAKAVNSVTGMTATATPLPAGDPATVTKTNNADGTINLAFGLPAGTKGDTGDKGDTGAAATVSVGSVTSGETPSVKNSGTNTAAILDFVLAKGDKGDTGLQGTQGAQGNTGTGISSAVLNGDYTLTLTFTDGTSYTTGSIRGEQGPQGIQGIQGKTGNGILSVTLVSGNHAAGTTDTYRITFTDATTFDFGVYNGADGLGSGDMSKSVYDPSGKNADAFNMTNMVEGTTNKVFTATERAKLEGVAENANNYVHPESHPASIIVQDTNNRFVTDAEKSTWNNKANKKVPTATGNIAILDATGNLADSGKQPSDFATSVQGTKADSAIQPSEMVDSNVGLSPDIATALGLDVATNPQIKDAILKLLSGTVSQASVADLYVLLEKVGSIAPTTSDKIPFIDVSGNTVGYSTIADLLNLTESTQVEIGSYQGTGNMETMSISFINSPRIVFIIGKILGHYSSQYNDDYDSYVGSIAMLSPSFGVSFSAGRYGYDKCFISSVLDIKSFTKTVSWKYNSPSFMGIRFDTDTNSNKVYYDSSDSAKQLANLSIKKTENNVGDRYGTYTYIALT